VLAIAIELLTAPPAQPPSPQAIAIKAAAIAARGAIRETRNKITEKSLMQVQSDIVKID
jgi:hypothetical protein